MSNVDEQLKQRFGRAIQPVATDDVLTQVNARRAHVQRRRQLVVVLLATSVLAATALGFLAMGRVFRGSPDQRKPAAPTAAGLVVVVTDPQTDLEHLELRTLDGTPPVRLTPDVQGTFSSIEASPDGHQLAFDFTAGGEHVALTILDIASGHQQIVRWGALSGAAWSPDGTRIAYYDFGDRPGVNILPLDGSGKASLVAGTGATGGNPSWSPDGTEITFEKRDAPGVPAVMAVNLASGEVRKLATTDGDTQAEPVFAPDGATIDLARWGGIWSVPAAGRDASLLTGLTREEWLAARPQEGPTLPTWSPDGHSLAYVWLRSTGSEVFVDHLDGSPGEPIGHGSDVTWLPSAEPPVSPTLATGYPERIDGVPFQVCRSTTVPGDFGPGLDRAWVFEEERAPGAGCIGSEGFQHLAIGANGAVTAMTARITDVLTEDAWKVWPFATPDIDGDGTDEIALAVAGGEVGSGNPDARRIWIFSVIDGAPVPLRVTCGGGCEAIPWDATIGPTGSSGGSSPASGVYCGALQGPQDDPADRGLVEWRTTKGDPLEISATLWHVRDATLLDPVRSTYRVADAAAYPPDGTRALCGSQTNEPPDFAY